MPTLRGNECENPDGTPVAPFRGVEPFALSSLFDVQSHQYVFRENEQKVYFVSPSGTNTVCVTRVESRIILRRGKVLGTYIALSASNEHARF